MSAEEIEGDFPKLRSDAYEITSPETTDYNCFAWAAHDTTQWWSPLPLRGYYWPDQLPRNTGVQTFVELYNRVAQFVPCENGLLEQGFEKVALYVNVNGNVTHAARQTASGSWTSKLGVMEDIEHQTLSAIEDGGVGASDYGRVAQFLKRPLSENRSR
jgi:hypothetical protein